MKSSLIPYENQIYFRAEIESFPYELTLPEGSCRPGGPLHTPPTSAAAVLSPLPVIPGNTIQQRIVPLLLEGSTVEEDEVSTVGQVEGSAIEQNEGSVLQQNRLSTVEQVAYTTDVSGRRAEPPAC